LLARHVREGVVAPLVDLVRRRGGAGFALLVGFVLLYKLGDALAATLGNVFLVELGFTKIQIANIAKTYGLLAAILGVLLGGWLVRAVGLWRALWIAGFVQMASNLMYALQARVGADAWLLVATIGIEDVSSGVGTAAFVAYLSGLCNKAYSATQYALLTALSGMLRNFLATSAGYLSEALGWQDFFLLTTAAAVPGLLMLYALGRWGAGASDAAPGSRTQA
jgi:PAT family beta-lactamase induction signal transducer AmpG